MKRLDPFQILLTLCAIGVGVLCFQFCPLEYWGSVLDALLVFLGLVVASLVQVIPVTANFLQAETLSSSRVSELQVALDRQQDYWLSLLLVSVLSAVLIVVAKFMLPTVVQHTNGTALLVMTGRSISGGLGFASALIIFKFLGIIPGIKSLQKIRFQLALDQARDRELGTQPSKSKPRRISKKTWPIPDDFGKIRETIDRNDTDTDSHP